jgi:glucosamine 6-phosphate synthetase-like amidotransferase/phosphosugar isomerase protein|tara:strand:+ start:2461 stop:3306 length:846 start_codon:yes stop_codon:yes gene_type:complete
MCGILGVHIKKPSLLVAKNLFRIFHNQKNRGTNGAGMALLRKGKITRVRSVTPFNLFSIGFLDFWSDVRKGDCILFHHRMPTSGGNGDRIKSNHPICDEKENVFVIHNGVIMNNDDLYTELIKGGHTFNTMTRKKKFTDSEIFAHLLENQNKGIKKIVKDVSGNFALAYFYKGQNSIHLFKDVTTPMSVFNDEEDNIYFASEFPNGGNFTAPIYIKPHTAYELKGGKLIRGKKYVLPVGNTPKRKEFGNLWSWDAKYDAYKGFEDDEKMETTDYWGEEDAR